MLVAYFYGLARQDHYHFFPFAMAATVWFAWKRIDWQTLSLGRLAIGLITCDVLLLVASCLVKSPWLAVAGALLLVVAVSWSASHDGRRPFEIALLFATVVRPPVNADLQLIQRLQPFTSRVAGAILDRLEILNNVAGNLIELSDKVLFVEEACSGVQSLFALVFIAAFIVAWRKLPPLQALLMILAAPVCALAMNVARVVIIATSWAWSEADFTEGLVHELLGYGLLTIATLFLFSANQLFAAIGKPIPGEWFINRQRTMSNPVAGLWNRLWSSFKHGPVSEIGPARPKLVASATAIGALLVATQCYSLFTLSDRPASLSQVDLDLKPPEVLGEFKLYDTERKVRSRTNSQGQYSEIWRYHNRSFQTLQSFDFPFVGWHDLHVCYVGLGWRTNERKIVPGDWPAVAFHMSKPNGERGYVIFSMLQADGTPLRPPSVNDLGAGIVSRLTKRGNWLGPSGTTYQSQTFAVSAAAFSDQQIASVNQQHLETRKLLQRELTVKKGETR